MRVTEITLRNACGHPDTHVKLPPAGLIVITGANGAGKSGLVEGVAGGVWGKTMRGTPPWHAETKALISVSTPTLHVMRTKTAKGSPKLQWAEASDDVSVVESTEFATLTKAQEALEHVVGPFDLWRRVHVFSSTDAAHFTLATDAERKRLLETILGLDRFDAALGDCRTDLRGLEREVREAKAQLSTTEVQVSSAERRIADATASIAALGPRPSQQTDLIDAAEHADAKRMLAECNAEMQSVRSELGAASNKLAVADAEVRSAKQRRSTFKRGGACPACKQPVPDEMLDSLDAEVDEAVSLAGGLALLAEARDLELRECLAELQEEATVLQARVGELAERRARASATRAECERYDRLRASHEKVLAEATKELKAVKKTARALAKRLSTKERELGVVSASETVLGLRGPRSTVLGGALGGIEEVANAWLDRLDMDGRGGSQLRVRLSGQSTTKKGDVVDAISMDVEGAGGGYGYKAASGGERRRIDVAILLALAEVAAAAESREIGTLWFDEVLDSLDDAGVDAVAAAMGTLASERCVVVITHSTLLADRLPATQRWTVAGGSVT